MLGTLSSISSLLVGIGILLAGMGLMGTQLAVRAGIEGFSAGVTGIVMSLYFLGYSIGAFVCPPIIRRVGHIRAFAAMASLASTTAILHAIVVDPVAWGLLRLINGACFVGLYMVIESWLNALTPTHIRGRVFGVYVMVSLAAMGVGQFLILVGDVAGFVNFGVASVLLSLALLPVAMTRVKEPPPVNPMKVSLRRLYALSPLGVIGALTAGITSGSFWGLGALFAHEAGLSEAGIALFMSAVIFGGAFLQWPVGHLSDHHDRRRVLIGVCVGAAVLSVGMLAILGVSMPAVFALAFLYGGVAFTVYGLSVSHVNDQVDPGEVLEAAKGLLLLHGLGATIGPIIGGFLMGALGHEVILAYVAIVFLLAAVFGVHRMRMREAPPVEAQASFVPMSRTSPEALALDPRLAPADEDEPVKPAAS